MQCVSAEADCNVCEKWECAPYSNYAGTDVLSRSLCCLNFQNLCDNFVQKSVSEIRKFRQLHPPYESGPVPEALISLVNVTSINLERLIRCAFS